MIFLPIALLSAQYWVYLQIIERLKTHHPNKWVGLGIPSAASPDTNEVTPEFLAERSLYAFLMKENVSKLKDSRLHRLVMAWRFLGIVAIILLIAALLGLFAQ